MSSVTAKNICDQNPRDAKSSKVIGRHHLLEAGLLQYSVEGATVFNMYSVSSSRSWKEISSLSIMFVKKPLFPVNRFLQISISKTI